MTAHPPIAAAITDARNKPRNMSPPAWVRTASMPRAPPRFESPLASLLSPSGLYCDAVPPDIPLDLAAALAERYELREVLGRGGMATVYLAYDRKHRRDVALKVLLPGLAAFLGVERFLKEIQVAARLTHPHILALHDSGEAGGFLYYVMPYIDGGSLRQQLAGGARLHVERALAIAAPVADALSYAHRMGVLHRDIKPENILFSQGHPIVADFGIAKAISTAGGANLTRTGFPVGTPGYMSPEQAAGLTDLDERTDVYSLTVVIYEVLVGEVPGRWPTASGAMTIGGVEALAAEVGIAPSVVRAAADSLGPSLGAPISAPESIQSNPWVGGPTTIVIERVLDGELPDTEYSVLVDETRRLLKNVGQVSQLGRSFSWVASPGATRRSLELVVSVRGGRTRITVQENLAPLIGAMFGGIGGGMGGGGMRPIIGILVGALHFPGVAMAATIPVLLGRTCVTARTA